MKYIPYGRHSIDNRDIRNVIKMLASDWITQGPRVKEFENALAKYCKVKYAVAVSSGTAALHLACLTAGLKRGDEAITSPITFLATPNSVLYTGATPVFADIDYRTVNIDLWQIERKITKKTKAILPVHFAGLPADMEKIYNIAKKNRLIVIEDACHALGAKYKADGKWIKVGSCRHSDMAVFSFHPVKIITTGEGGAITTNNKQFYEKLKALRNHGVYRDAATGKKGLWYYEMRNLGFNYRITDFQCALGISQLKKINAFIKRRKQIAHRYNEFFKDKGGITVPFIDDNASSSWHLYALKVNYRYFGVSRTQLMHALMQHNIGTQVRYIPVYRQPFYKARFHLDRSDFPQSESYYERALSIPIFAALADNQIDYIIHRFRALIGRLKK
jgi:UDP-4-amino-4,6-dideoxy-N-acetyl-beta-L-altrosamine transaminase